MPRAYRAILLLAVALLPLGTALVIRHHNAPNAASHLRWQTRLGQLDLGIMHRELKVGATGTVYALGQTHLTAVAADSRVL